MLESDLWSQKWHAKSWVYWFDNCLNQHNFLHHFAKPLLASHYTNQLQAWRQILETATIAYSLSLVFQGLQPEVQQSTDCPTGSRALWSQTWLRKIDARNCIETFSYRTNRRNFLRRFCEAMSGFAKLLSPKGKLRIVALLVGALQFLYSKKWVDFLLTVFNRK